MAELWLKRDLTGQCTSSSKFEHWDEAIHRQKAQKAQQSQRPMAPQAEVSSGHQGLACERFLGTRGKLYSKSRFFAAGEFSLWRQSTTSSVEKARTSPCRKRRYVKIPAELLLPSWTSNKNFFSSTLLQYRVPLRLFSYFRGRDVLFCLSFLVYSHRSILWSLWLTFPMGF